MKTLSGCPFELQTLPASQIKEGQVFLAQYDTLTSIRRFLVVRANGELMWQNYIAGKIGDYSSPMADENNYPFDLDMTKGRGMDGVVRM